VYDPETSCGVRRLQSEVWYGRQSFVEGLRKNVVNKVINKWPSNTAVLYNINIATYCDLSRSLSG